MNLANPTDELAPPCVNRPSLFESIHIADHDIARDYCARCPAAIFTECKTTASQQANHDGTWAGVLYRNGRVARVAKRRAA